MKSLEELEQDIVTLNGRVEALAGQLTAINDRHNATKGRLRSVAEASHILVEWIDAKPKLWGPPKPMMARIKAALGLASQED